MRYLAIASLIILAAGPAVAATTPSDQASSTPATQPAQTDVPARTDVKVTDETAQNQTVKTDANKSKLADPDAGVDDKGAPNSAVTNGGELKK